MKIKINDKVKINGSNLYGTILNINRNNVTINVNGKKMNLKIDNISPISDDEFKILNSPKVIYRYTQNKSYTLVTTSKPAKELMIRHQDSITAMQNVEKFLDTAYLNRYTEVVIIHGKSGGILRKALHELLDSHPLVLSYELGNYHSGQHGVTIVKLKIMN